MATVTIRLIRSFEHRNLKHVVYHDVDLTQSVGTFIDFVKNGKFTPRCLSKNNDFALFAILQPVPSGFFGKTKLHFYKIWITPPFKKYSFDTLKISHKAYGYKSNDPVINLEDDEKLILKEECTLKENGVDNETEISFFRMEDYLEYKKNPHLAW